MSRILRKKVKGCFHTEHFQKTNSEVKRSISEEPPKKIFKNSTREDCPSSNVMILTGNALSRKQHKTSSETSGLKKKKLTLEPSKKHSSSLVLMNSSSVPPSIPHLGIFSRHQTGSGGS